MAGRLFQDEHDGLSKLRNRFLAQMVRRVASELTLQPVSCTSHPVNSPFAAAGAPVVRLADAQAALPPTGLQAVPRVAQGELCVGAAARHRDAHAAVGAHLHAARTQIPQREPPDAVRIP
eukprot:5578749-Prymnesium_polylepis.4